LTKQKQIGSFQLPAMLRAIITKELFADNDSFSLPVSSNPIISSLENIIK